MQINRRRMIMAGLASAMAAPWLVARAQSHAPALVAVATNFAKVAEMLAVEFETKTGMQITIASGATGQLFAQVINGAPYDVFLAADQARPEKLEAAGLSFERLTYARGFISLWNPAGAASEEVLRAQEYSHLAIANPALAPYGRAAQEVLQALGLWEKLQGKIVMGQNVGQAYALVASGNAGLGFVDASRMMELGGHWLVPPNLYSPILQDAVLLRDAPVARAFMGFLASETAGEIITGAGYQIP